MGLFKSSVFLVPFVRRNPARLHLPQNICSKLLRAKTYKTSCQHQPNSVLVKPCSDSTDVEDTKKHFK